MVEMVGPYRIVEELGRGGMGIVLRGVHDRLEREVAIKQLAPELTSNPQFKERFFSEAKTQAQLQHPNIVTIYDLIEDRGEYFIVMELFPGRGLDEIVYEAQGRGMPEERALSVFRQVLEALDSAHSLGVIHRDVKPSNVLIGEGGKVKLMDFGIALLVGDKRLTQSSQTIGTPVYMSPEQVLRPKELDHRTDIYSAAVMLFEMLAGRAPFDAETEYEIKKLHIEASPTEAVQTLEGVSQATVRALERALEKDPEQRFSSAQEFLRSLPLEVGALAPATPAPTRQVDHRNLPAEVLPSTRQNRGDGARSGRVPGPWLWAGTGALLLVLLLGAWLLMSRGGQDIGEPAPVESAQVRASVPSPPGSSPSPSQRRVVPPPATPDSPPEQTEEKARSTSEPPLPRVDPAEEARRKAADEQRIRARVVDETRKQVQGATTAARRLLADGSYEEAREAVKRALSQSAPYRSELVDEVVALQLLEQKVTDEILSQRTREEAARERERLERQNWEGRIAEVESLIEEGKYPEAQQLAERLLEDSSLPEDLTEQAQGLRERAREELKSVWGKTEVEGSTEVINPRKKKGKEGDGEPEGGRSWQ